uniref:Uncharacterized protein n=1 Tax=Anguilla anguilla TaxID=7936 RepID=A0A0E9WPW4_ANGAN
MGTRAQRKPRPRQPPASESWISFPVFHFNCKAADAQIEEEHCQEGYEKSYYVHLEL